ncbi:MAG: putative bifunctional diguanylate cyclase/phosphodiesterase [bacterium]
MEETETKILLAEDDCGDARLLREMLSEVRHLNFSLHHVETLTETVEALRKFTFDVVFLDLSLPDSHGFTTFCRVHDQAPNVPIILMTGNDDQTLVARALNRGAQDYLVKGKFDSELLVRSTRYAIERHRLRVEMEKARALEQHLAYHDALTSLPNRLLFMERLQQALVYAKRYDSLLAVLFMDLDGLKQINDTKGHAAGDELLQAVARRLTHNVRESDTVARLGGDEFIILLKGIKKVEDVTKVASKILRAVSTPCSIVGEKIEVTASVGISVFPYDGSDNEDLIKKADFAMYRAKSKGKNRHQLFNMFVNIDSGRQVSLESSLRQAVENKSLRLFFQPQVALQSGNLIGMEALLRWQLDDLVMLQPADFMPMAEDTGLIVPIGKWVLREACLQNRRWQESGYPPIPVAVNLSARQFREVSLVETVASAIRDTRLSPSHLVLEITETSAMEDIEFTITTLKALKEMGVRIALDDFGIGYSSLSYLKRLPIDFLKVDKCFVRDVPKNPDDVSIIKAIVALAQNLGIKVIAEGVEKKDQLSFLKSIRCEQVQGFYFSPALSPARFRELLASNKGWREKGIPELEVHVV